VIALAAPGTGVAPGDAFDQRLVAPGLLGRLPFLLSTGLFVFGFIAVFSFERKRALRTLGGALLMSVAVSLSVSLLFEQLFLVRLP
jgi:hypothetical protein